MDPGRFARTFDVLDLLVDHPEGLNTTEISRALSLPVSSTHNLLRTMVEAEIAHQTGELRYLLGPRAVRFGIRTVYSLETRTFGRRHVSRLAKSTGLDVHLAVRVGSDVVFTDRFAGTAPVGIEVRAGQPLHLHANAVGKLFAAYEPDLRSRVLSEPLDPLTAHTIVDRDELERELDAIRHEGFAVSEEEAVESVAEVAVPIVDPSGRLTAAVNIFALQTSVPLAERDGILNAVMGVARAIEAEIGVASSEGAHEHEPTRSSA